MNPRRPALPFPEIHLTSAVSRRGAVPLAGLAWLGLLLAVAPAQGAEAAMVQSVPEATAASPAPVKVLFMGTDLAVLHKKEFHRVRAVENGAFVIEVNGRKVRLPLKDRSLRIKVEPSLKLAGNSAIVSKLKGERDYSPSNDPRLRYDASTGADLGAAAQVDLAVGSLLRAQEHLKATEQAAAAPFSSVTPEELQAAKDALDKAHASLTPTVLQVESDVNNPAVNAGRIHDELAKENYDAISVDFVVSSDRPLPAPYVVVVTRYRERNTPPGNDRQMVYAKELKPIDAKPTKVSIRQGGFPIGYQLENYEVHLYNAGEEIATNVAPKQVTLGADEAFQYMVIEHITGHKNETLPAEAMAGQMPTDLRLRLPADQFARTYYVKVSKDGRAVGAYVDQKASKEVGDAYLAAVLKRLLFKPALEKGRPVESVCAVRLSDLPE